MAKDAQKFRVIIVAAGHGKRMSSDVPKQYMRIAGKTILQHTIDVFQSHSAMAEICVVIHPDYKDMVGGVPYCLGGDTRKESVYSGLKALKGDGIVLVHDAARPFVTHTDIDKLLKAMKTNICATLAMPVADSLRRDNGDIIDRDGLWAIQTPQAFEYAVLRQAHDKANPNVSYTDDTAMVAELGHRVAFIGCGRHNFKITYPEDLTLAKKLLSTYQFTETRIGQGYDVHAFDDDAQQSVEHITLCGVDIPYTRQLKGHSDADVGLHALTDAIYGAIGAGDIGMHFPPSDNAFKNMDSAVFLEHALEMLRDKGGEIINADVTLICERPKVGPFREAIIERIADIMSADVSRVNIKATTSEQLGFTGREEGIAAQAVVSVRMPV